MDKLLIGLIGVGTVLLAVGIAIGCTPLVVVGVIFLGVGMMLTAFLAKIGGGG